MMRLVGHTLVLCDSHTHRYSTFITENTLHYTLVSSSIRVFYEPPCLTAAITTPSVPNPIDERARFPARDLQGEICMTVAMGQFLVQGMLFLPKPEQLSVIQMADTCNVFLRDYPAPLPSMRPGPARESRCWRETTKWKPNLDIASSQKP